MRIVQEVVAAGIERRTVEVVCFRFPHRKVATIEAEEGAVTRDLPVVCRVCGGRAYAQDWVREAG